MLIRVHPLWCRVGFGQLVRGDDVLGLKFTKDQPRIKISLDPGCSVLIQGAQCLVRDFGVTVTLTNS